MVPGYWNKPEETENALRAPDGSVELKTGDVGYMDAQGWFYVVDRKKDQINAGGYKVWPREVEDVLYEHPAVREAAVVGVPDEYRGETVKAFVSVRPGAGRSTRTSSSRSARSGCRRTSTRARSSCWTRSPRPSPASCSGAPCGLTGSARIGASDRCSRRTNSLVRSGPGLARRRHAESATIARDSVLVVVLLALVLAGCADAPVTAPAPADAAFPRG